MSPLEKVEGVGAASIFRGDPRLPTQDIDLWYQGMLTEIRPASSRMWLYGSDAGHCARRNVLLEHNTWLNSETSAASAAYMSIGVALENMLAAGLQSKGRLIQQSMNLVQMAELRIRGKVDLVIIDHEERLALVEVKTCGRLPTEPKPPHLAQIQTYAAVSGIRRCWLTYISRNVVTEPWSNGCAMRSFSVDTSDAALSQRLQVAALSRLAADAAVLPPVPAHFRKHTECHTCEFRDAFCWAIRRGKGGTPPAAAPLPEMTPKEHIYLDSSAKVLGDKLFESIRERKLETLNVLLGIEDLEILRKERDEVIRELLS